MREKKKSSGNKCFPEESVHFCITLHSHTTPAQELLDARVPRLRSLIWLKTAGGQGEDYRESGEQHASCVHTLISGGSHAIVFNTLWSDSPSVTTAKRLHSLRVLRFTSNSIRINCLWFVHPSGLEKVEESLMRLSIAILELCPFFKERSFGNAEWWYINIPLNCTCAAAC